MSAGRYSMDDARGTRCPNPQCDHVFSISTRTANTCCAPQPGHHGVCMYCGTIFRIDPDGLLFKFVIVTESDLPEPYKSELPKIRAEQKRIAAMIDKINGGRR